MIELFFAGLGALLMYCILRVPNKGVAVLVAMVIIAGAIFAIAYREEREE